LIHVKEKIRYRFSRAFRIGKPVFSFLESGIRNVIDFVYPPLCLLCEDRSEDGYWLCPACCNRIQKSSHVIFQQRPEDFVYLSEELFFDGVFTCWEFNSDLEQLVHQMKYSQMKNLARHFGKTAGKVLTSHLNSEVFQLMLPIPLHKVRQRERGYNQSERVCEGLYESLAIPIQKDILVRKRYTRTQTDLSAEERQDNMRDVFRVRRPERIKSKSVLIVDDVVTTGSTMNSCAKVLKEAGARTVVCIALARPSIRAKFI
jgi:competence protein ComFC